MLFFSRHFETRAYPGFLILRHVRELSSGKWRLFQVSRRLNLSGNDLGCVCLQLSARVGELMNRSLRRKLRISFSVGAIMIPLLFFQNCGKVANLQQVNPSSTPTEVYKIEAKQFRDVIIPDMSKNRNLDLDVDSGIVRDGSGNRFCLDSSSIQEIQNILASANVCQPTPSNDPDVVCTMIYKYPYARLKSASLDLALGEARNGCDKGMDLCGDAASKLRVFVSGVISRIDGMRCN